MLSTEGAENTWFEWSTGSLKQVPAVLGATHQRPCPCPAGPHHPSALDEPSRLQNPPLTYIPKNRAAIEQKRCKNYATIHNFENHHILRPEFQTFSLKSRLNSGFLPEPLILARSPFCIVAMPSKGSKQTTSGILARFVCIFARFLCILA